jgi:hypothetical protein
MRTMFYNNSSCLCVLYTLDIEGLAKNISHGYISMFGNDYCKNGGMYNTYNAHRDRTMFYSFINISVENDVVSDI